MVTVAAIAVAAGGAIAFVLTSHTGSSPRATRTTTTVTASPSPVVALADARALVVRYLDDVNAQNRVAARELICGALVDDWQSTIDQPGGDFTVTVNQATLVASRATATGLDLEYTLNLKAVDTGALSVSTVVFTVVDLGGTLKICGEN